jgi:hypothetical protein
VQLSDLEVYRDDHTPLIYSDGIIRLERTTATRQSLDQGGDFEGRDGIKSKHDSHHPGLGRLPAGVGQHFLANGDNRSRADIVTPGDASNGTAVCGQCRQNAAPNTRRRNSFLDR